MEKKIKILLVDDDRDLLQVLQMALQMNPLFKVITAINGQDGCFKFRNEEFDVIVTDLKMPKMDGIEFINAINKIKEVPIIVISASLEEFKFKITDYKLKAMRNLHVLPKPFVPDDLSEKLKSIIKLTAVATSTPAKETQPDNHCRYKAGQIVFEENSIPEDMYIVKEGTFVVFKQSSRGENVLVAKISVGEVLGEMALFNGGLRSTTIMAQTDGILIKFPLEKVKDIINSQPFWFRVMMKTMSNRLVETTTALVEARSEIQATGSPLKKEA